MEDKVSNITICTYCKCRLGQVVYLAKTGDRFGFCSQEHLATWKKRKRRFNVIEGGGTRPLYRFKGGKDDKRRG